MRVVIVGLTNRIRNTFLSTVAAVSILAGGNAYAVSELTESHVLEPGTEVSVQSEDDGVISRNPKVFGRFSGYFDSREQATSTLTVGASDLPMGMKFSGFLEYASKQGDFDSVGQPYGEFRLVKRFDSGFGPAIEYNRSFAQDSGVTRQGGIFEPSLKNVLPDTRLGVKFFPAATGDSGVQIGVYGSSRLNDHLELSGAIDYNIAPNRWFGELQVGYRLVDGFNAVVEGRYNGALPDNSVGVAVGIETVF